MKSLLNSIREFLSRRRCQSTGLSGRQCRNAAVTSGKPAFCAEHKDLVTIKVPDDATTIFDAYKKLPDAGGIIDIAGSHQESISQDFKIGPNTHMLFNGPAFITFTK